MLDKLNFIFFIHVLTIMYCIQYPMSPNYCILFFSYPDLPLRKLLIKEHNLFK